MNFAISAKNFNHDFTIKYLWKNRYRGDFEDDTTLYSKSKLMLRRVNNESNHN